VSGASCRVHLSGEGSLANVAQLLYGLDHASIFFAIENFSLVLKDENTGNMKVEIDIFGVAFS
jgi:hypothetical protein